VDVIFLPLQKRNNIFLLFIIIIIFVIGIKNGTLNNSAALSVKEKSGVPGASFFLSFKMADLLSNVYSWLAYSSKNVEERNRRRGTFTYASSARLAKATLLAEDSPVF
jgi:hypothetical protein